MNNDICGFESRMRFRAQLQVSMVLLPDCTATAGMELPAQVPWLRWESIRFLTGRTQVRVLREPFTREIFYRKEMVMAKKLAESTTLFGALFLLCGTDSSIWCGVCGLVLLISFSVELYLWEEHRSDSLNGIRTGKDIWKMRKRSEKNGEFI